MAAPNGEFSKRFHPKTRTGCLECKKRRVKCDEKHPTCTACTRRREQCVWPDSGVLSPRTSTTTSIPASVSSSQTSFLVGEIEKLKLFHRWLSNSYSADSQDSESYRVTEANTEFAAGNAKFLKRYHHKTRTGCIGCKTRRVKCDEKHPACTACTRRRERCVWPDNRLVEGTISPRKPIMSSSQALAAVIPPQASLVVGNTENMKLLHHWYDYCYALANHDSVEGRRANRHDLPMLGFQRPFLLHSLLAAAALDLAHQRGSHQPDPYYFSLYQTHTQASLLTPPPKPGAVLTMEEGMAQFARFALLSMLALACRNIDCTSWKPKLLVWILGSRASFGVFFGEIKLSWTSIGYSFVNQIVQVAEAMDDSSGSSETDLDWHGQESESGTSLHSSLRKIHLPHCGAPDSAEVEDPEVSQMYLDAVNKLATAYRLVDRPSLGVPALLSIALLWSTKFVQALKCRKPRALVILAHYHILYLLIITQRQIGRHPEDDMSKIFDVLPLEWRSWLAGTLPEWFNAMRFEVHVPSSISTSEDDIYYHTN